MSESAADGGGGSPPEAVGFAARGRVRRRVRFLRKARELAYRDLGGLVFNLHRFGARNDALVLAKLSTLSGIDSELRALESALAERQPVTVLREAGVTACPRCAAIHSSEDRYCPNCGLPISRHVDLPIAGPASGAPAPGAQPQGIPAPAPAGPQARVPGTPAPFASAPAPPAGAPAGAAGAQGPASGSQSSVSEVPSPSPPGGTEQESAIPSGRPFSSAGRAPPPPARPAQGEDEPTEIVRPSGTGA